MKSTPPPLARQAGGLSVWHPETLDVEKLLDTYGQRVGEGVLWLGHCVYVGLADDARCRHVGRVPLKTEYLRNVVGWRYLDAVRQAAIDAGYLGRDPSYRAGHYSQTYWILSPHAHARPVLREIADFGLRHNIEKWRESRHREMWQQIQRNETLVDKDVCGHLCQNLRQVRISQEIDGSESLEPTEQVEIGRLRQGELRFKVDDFGRVHTNLTNLAKPLRQYLAVDGKRLMNVDIGESQPVFLGMALATDHNREHPMEGRGREGDRPHSLMMHHTMMHAHPQSEVAFDRTALPADLRRYLELCEARSFYQTVANQLGRTRDAAKKRIMAVFFGRPWHHNKVSAVLDGLFPTAMESMRRIKRQDYCRLAHLAQRIESAFMFGRVVPRIMAERPQLFVSTIHDSILTTTGDEEYVRNVMLYELARLGLSPQVKIEPCSG